MLRLPALIGSVLLGLALTVDAAGLAIYQWPLWWLRGRIRLLLQGRSITPAALPGAAQQAIRVPLRLGGPIRPSRRTQVRVPASEVPIEHHPVR
jgi:hypothetical protein